MSIVWNAALETGHRTIDLQHQELVELINDAASAHHAGRDTVVLEEIMPRLASYVLFHFSTEETLMTGLPSSHTIGHRMAHREFTGRIDAMKEAVARGEAPSLAPLLAYLKAWLIEHIMKTDQEMVRQLHARTRPKG
jgi:hemerythrin-like metal-binding protein